MPTLSEIGLSYLAIPVITWGHGALLAAASHE